MRHVLDGYRSVIPAIGRDLDHLDLFVRVRWMSHAIYFADRIERGVLRRVTGPDGNEEGARTGVRGDAGRRLTAPEG